MGRWGDGVQGSRGAGEQGSGGVGEMMGWGDEENQKPLSYFILHPSYFILSSHSGLTDSGLRS
jgi:hypothetical protein